MSESRSPARKRGSLTQSCSSKASRADSRSRSEPWTKSADPETALARVNWIMSQPSGVSHRPLEASERRNEAPDLFPETGGRVGSLVSLPRRLAHAAPELRVVTKVLERLRQRLDVPRGDQHSLDAI